MRKFASAHITISLQVELARPHSHTDPHATHWRPGICVRARALAKSEALSSPATIRRRPGGRLFIMAWACHVFHYACLRNVSPVNDNMLPSDRRCKRKDKRGDCQPPWLRKKSKEGPTSLALAPLVHLPSFWLPLLTYKVCLHSSSTCASFHLRGNWKRIQRLTSNSTSEATL